MSEMSTFKELHQLSDGGLQQHKNAADKYYQDIFVRLPANTQRAYQSDLNDYKRYCEENGLSIFSRDHDVTEDSLKQYFLNQCGEGAAYSSIMRRKSAISSFLDIAKLPNPLKSKYLNELIKRELVQADTPVRSVQASALTGDLLEKINRNVSPDCLVNARDLSLVNTMFDGLLRASEAANLTIGSINRRNNTQFISFAKK